MDGTKGGTMDGTKVTVGQGNTRIELRCEHQAGLLYVVEAAVMNWVCSRLLRPVHSLAGFFGELTALNDARVREVMQRWGLYYRPLSIDAEDAPSEGPSLNAGTTGEPAPELNDLGTLSPREIQCLALAAEGLSNERIGETLDIRESTVKSHIGHVLLKLRASDRTHAVVRAIKQGYLTVEVKSARPLP